DSDALTRARWLIALVGSPAARWSLASIADATDEALFRALSTLIERKHPASWTLADLEQALRGGAPIVTGSTSFESPVEVALALAGDKRRAAIEAVEQGRFSSP